MSRLFSRQISLEERFQKSEQLGSRSSPSPLIQPFWALDNKEGCCCRLIKFIQLSQKLVWGSTKQYRAKHNLTIQICSDCLGLVKDPSAEWQQNLNSSRIYQQNSPPRVLRQPVGNDGPGRSCAHHDEVVLLVQLLPLDGSSLGVNRQLEQFRHRKLEVD